MSDDKSKVTDKASEIARNIWLAGVGAYGKAVEDAQDRIEKAMEPPKLFKDLVKAGSALEEDARTALETTAQARQSVEERISKVRENFQMQRPARIEDIAALERKVEQLARQVTALTRALTEQGLAVKPERKATAKKKAAAKKPAARKKPATAKKSSSRQSGTKSAGSKARVASKTAGSAKSSTADKTSAGTGAKRKQAAATGRKSAKRPVAKTSSAARQSTRKPAAAKSPRRRPTATSKNRA